jgi:hypothetical protein
LPSKTLVLHIGLPKCASTYVQHFLSDNVKILAGKDVFYDHPSSQTRPTVANADGLRDVMASLDQDRLDTYLDQFLHRDGTVVMSSETLIDMARFSHPKQFLATVAARGYRLKLVCIARRQDHWIEADFKQHIKDISPWSNPLPALIARRRELRILDYHWLLSNWAKLMDREDIVLIPMRPNESRTAVLERFLKLLGCDELLGDCNLPDAKNQNSSPPAGLIEPARHIKRSLQREGKTVDRISLEVGRFLDKAAATLDVPSRRFLMSLEARQALVSEYGASNALLSQDFFDGQPVFEDEFISDPASEDDLGDEAAGFLLDYFNQKKRTSFF